MKIPADAIERRVFYAEVAKQCDASRSERFEFYKQLRNYYLFGTQDSSGADYNKIASTVETLCSFIYAPDAARFSIHLGSTAPKLELKKIPPLVHELNDQWRMGRSHILFGLALRWALVFGCTIVKGLWRRGVFRPYLVEPHQFGVLREDVWGLDDQEAFIHHYTITKSNLEMELKDNPRRAEIMSRVNRGAVEGEATTLGTGGMDRLVLSAGVSLTSPTTGPGGEVADGMTRGPGVSYDYAPKVDGELVDMAELWVWNDDENDFQVATMACSDVVVYDRKNFGVRGMSPFVKVTAGNNMYDYFWEQSFVAQLTGLQTWRMERVRQIRELLAKNVDPAMAFSGFSAITDEKMAAMRSAGGMLSTPMPGAKAETFAPQIPTNLFGDLDMIDKMFDDQAGIGHILQGKGEAGVRSKGQADLLARLGSARPKQRAIVAEEAAEDLATLLLRNVQAHSDQRFPIHDEKDSEGAPLSFIASQFTNDFEVRVDAHSSSPIFVEDRKNDAYQLLEARAITRERLLEMVDPPGLQLLKEELKGIEDKEAQAQQAQQQAQGPAKARGGDQ